MYVLFDNWVSVVGIQTKSSSFFFREKMNKVHPCTKAEAPMNTNLNQNSLSPFCLCCPLNAVSVYSVSLLAKNASKKDEKSSISASKITVTPICHGILSRNFFERFDFVTKKNRFRDKPIFSLTHKIRFRDKPIFSLTKKNSIS